MKFITFFSLIFINLITLGQDSIVAFNDANGFFYMLEYGKLQRLSGLAAKDFQFSKMGLVYIDNQGDLYIKKTGVRPERLEYTVNLFTATDNLLAWQTASILKVYDNGTKKTLCGNTGKWFATDSLIVFEDLLQVTYNVYYKGEIHPLESGIFDDPTYQDKIGKNIMVYKNIQQWYKAFYEGQLIEIGAFQEDIDFEVGRNMLAFNHPFQQNFQAMYYGEFVLLEEQPAKKYKVGDEMVAYQDNQGNLKVYFNDEIFNVSSYEPDWFKVKDSLVVFQENGTLRVFDNGNTYTVENYIPSEIKYRYRDLLYTDQSGGLRLFRNGKSEIVTQEWVQSYSLGYKSMVIELPNSRMAVYNNGELIYHR